MGLLLKTDFEECGYSEGYIKVPDRLLLLTVDFEAFTPEMMPLWEKAMHYWAECEQQYRLRCCFFLSVEDVVRLRRSDISAYEDFKRGLKTLNRAGSMFYPHNHVVFDPDSGMKMTTDKFNGFPEDYKKRFSMFYSVVYCHKLDIAEWLKTVKGIYEGFLADAGCAQPRGSVFRAGGWDYGSSCSDLSQYMSGLLKAGFGMDSSACRGTFGTPAWRVGTVFGLNVIRLTGGLVETAPCWSLDCSTEPLSRAYTGNILRLREHRMLWTGNPGVFMIVVHFDHLFHKQTNKGIFYFAVRDIEMVKNRIKRLFRLLVFLQSVLFLRCVTFDELGL